MPRARYYEMVNPYEDTIRHLREELYLARTAIIDLMPVEIEKILTSYYSCETRKETYEWIDSTAYRIIDFAKILPSEGYYSSDRAYCPLCGDGSSSPFDRGFSVPEGLRRHLVGWGSARQCTVFGAAMSLARDWWHEKFHEQEEAERAEEETRLLERRKTETVYKTSPYHEPELIDEGIGYGDTPRNAEELVWAEGRLSSLGFQINCEANVKSYISEQESFVVYADPEKLVKSSLRSTRGHFQSVDPNVYGCAPSV